jgi:hypothetical protein
MTKCEKYQRIGGKKPQEDIRILACPKAEIRLFRDGENPHVSKHGTYARGGRTGTNL